MEIDNEKINRLYKYFNKVDDIIDVPIGYIGTYSVSSKDKAYNLFIKGICLDKYVTNKQSLILLSGISDNTPYYNWVPLELLYVNKVRFSDNQIRKMFENQLKLYNMDRLSEDNCFKLNLDIIHSLGYITEEEFIKFLNNGFSKKVSNICNSSLGFSNDNNKKVIEIIEIIKLHKDDMITIENEMLSSNVYKNAKIDKEIGKIFFKSGNKDVIDLYSIYSNQYSSWKNLNFNRLISKYEKFEHIFIVNNKVTHERKIEYDKEVNEFSYFHTMSIPMSVVKGYTIEDVKLILDQIVVKHY